MKITVTLPKTAKYHKYYKGFFTYDAGLVPGLQIIEDIVNKLRRDGFDTVFSCIDDAEEHKIEIGLFPYTKKGDQNVS